METINTKDQEVVKIGDWILTIFLTAIPIVGLILLLVWAFGGNAPA